MRSLLLSIPLLCVVTAANAHYMTSGGRCRDGSCPMCVHNNAHRRGLKHSNGVWYNPRQQQPTYYTSTPANTVTVQNKEYTIVNETASTTPEVEPSRDEVIDAVLEAMNLTKDDTLYDIGCGDGRVLIRAYEKYGCHCVGIEIDSELAYKARVNIEKAGHKNRIYIVNGNAETASHVEYATAVYMFLYEELAEKIIPRCKRARVIANVNHGLPGIPEEDQQEIHIGSTVASLVHYDVTLGE